MPGAGNTEGRHEPDEQRHPLLGNCRDLGRRADSPVAAARFAAAPVADDYLAGGRDFAPGLAGKYTTSNADAEDEDYYDSYEAPRLRAVGD